MFFQWYKYSVINIKTFYQSFPFLCSMFTLFRLKRWNSPEHSVCSVELIWLWRTNLFNIKCPWVRKKHTILPCKTASGTITECFSLSVSIHILVFFSTDTQKMTISPVHWPLGPISAVQTITSSPQSHLHFHVFSFCEDRRRGDWRERRMSLQQKQCAERHN